MVILFVCSTVVFLVRPADLRAQMWGYPDPSQNPRFFMNAASLYQPSSHVQGGGDVSVSRYSLLVGSSLPVNDKVSLGVGISYEFDDYNFSRLSSFAVPDPWNKIDLPPLIVPPSELDFLLFFEPLLKRFAGTALLPQALAVYTPRNCVA